MRLSRKGQASPVSVSPSAGVRALSRRGLLAVALCSITAVLSAAATHANGPTAALDCFATYVRPDGVARALADSRAPKRLGHRVACAARPLPPRARTVAARAERRAWPSDAALGDKHRRAPHAAWRGVAVAMRGCPAREIPWRAPPPADTARRLCRRASRRRRWWLRALRDIGRRGPPVAPACPRLPLRRCDDTSPPL